MADFDARQLDQLEDALEVTPNSLTGQAFASPDEELDIDVELRLRDFDEQHVHDRMYHKAEWTCYHLARPRQAGYRS